MRVTAPDVEELKRRCNQVRDFYDDASIKLVRPIGDMMGLHSEFIPASKRYMNDYVQYVTSDFLAGLGFGATQMLGERDGIYLGYNVDTDQKLCMCSLQERHKALRVLLPMRCPVLFLGSLGGGKSLSFNLLTYYAVLNGAQALILDPKSERGLWKEKLPEIADEINIVNLTSDEENKGMLDPYIIMRKTKDAEVLRWMYSLSLRAFPRVTASCSLSCAVLFVPSRTAKRAVCSVSLTRCGRMARKPRLRLPITLNRLPTMTLRTCCSQMARYGRPSALKSS